MPRFLLSTVLVTSALALAACDEQKISEDTSAPPPQQSALPAANDEVQPATAPPGAAPAAPMLMDETEATPSAAQ